MMECLVTLAVTEFGKAEEAADLKLNMTVILSDTFLFPCVDCSQLLGVMVSYKR